jgi:hypothetical protein
VIKSLHLLLAASLLPSLACVNLDGPEAVQACGVQGLCINQTPVGGDAGSQEEAGSVGSNDDVDSGGQMAPGTGGTIGQGGSVRTGGIISTGSIAGQGNGGSVAPDGRMRGDGTSGFDGSLTPDGPSSSGGVSGRGGIISTGSIVTGGIVSAAGIINTGGIVSAAGIINTGGIVAGGIVAGGIVSTGGIISTGGIVTGGIVSTGGIVTGGIVSTGGIISVGGIVSTGGTSTTMCGTTKSTLSQTFLFTTGLGNLKQNPPTLTGALLSYATAGPTANPTLCTAAAGCAALSMTFASGTAAWSDFVTAVEFFVPNVSLVGSTVKFNVAVDNPGNTPIQLEGFSLGDQSTNLRWTQPTIVSGSALATYAASTGFKDITLVASNIGKYCAAETYGVGIQIQNTTAITSATAGTITAYIHGITITPGL